MWLWVLSKAQRGFYIVKKPKVAHNLSDLVNFCALVVLGFSNEHKSLGKVCWSEGTLGGAEHRGLLLGKVSWGEGTLGGAEHWNRLLGEVVWSPGRWGSTEHCEILESWHELFWGISRWRGSEHWELLKSWHESSRSPGRLRGSEHWHLLKSWHEILWNGSSLNSHFYLSLFIN